MPWEPSGPEARTPVQQGGRVLGIFKVSGFAWRNFWSGGVGGFTGKIIKFLQC